MFSIGKKKLWILDFDTECRPMHYNEWRPESQITAIAWSWIGSAEVRSRVLRQDLFNELQMFADFLADFGRADIVTGHYIRKHDLPLLNDHAMRFGYGTLGSKLTQDTMSDMRDVKSLGKSQDNIATTFGLAEAKHHMTGADWRVANALDESGRELARTRVVNDVIQHKAIRRKLLDEGALHSPRVWTP